MSVIAILLASALSLTPTTTGKTAQPDLVACLAYLARAPEYATLTDDELGRNERFLDAAQRSYCSDETSAFWPIAHEKARAALGITREGPPAPGQQDIAEREMRIIVANAWLSARTIRASTTSLPPPRMTGFVLSWLLDVSISHEDLPQKPFICARDAIRKSQNLTPADLYAGLANPALRAATAGCGLEEIHKSLTMRVRTRFPEIIEERATAITSHYLGQMLFWATLSQ